MLFILAILVLAIGAQLSSAFVVPLRNVDSLKSFDVEGSRVDVGLDSYISQKVDSATLQSLTDLKKYLDERFKEVTERFKENDRNVAERFKEIAERFKEIAERFKENDVKIAHLGQVMDAMEKSIWWLKPMVALLAVIATILVTNVVDLLASAEWFFKR
jgi:predicted nuclease with TOPRIM domain